MKPTVPVVLNLEERLLAALLEYCRQSGLPFEEAVPGLLTLSMERVLQARVSTDELDLIVQEALTFVLCNPEEFSKTLFTSAQLLNAYHAADSVPREIDASSRKAFGRRFSKAAAIHFMKAKAGAVVVVQSGRTRTNASLYSVTLKQPGATLPCVTQ